MEAKQVTVLFWDDVENFNRPDTQTLLGIQDNKSLLYKDVIRFNNMHEFNELKDKINSEEFVIILCHISFGKNYKGYHDFKIFQESNSIATECVYYVSSNKEAHSKFIKSNSDKIIIQTYSEIKTLLKASEISAYKPSFVFKSEALNMIPSKTTSSNIKSGIFLSYSSTDYEIIEKFRDLVLIAGLGRKLADIKFTSNEASGIEGGINIPNNLQSFLKNEMIFFVQFLSKSYVKSRVCQNEEGAAWVLVDDLMYLPILLSDAKVKDISWIKNHNKGIKIDNKDSLLSIYNSRKDFFGHDINITQLNSKIDEFLLWFNSRS